MKKNSNIRDIFFVYLYCFNTHNTYLMSKYLVYFHIVKFLERRSFDKAISPIDILKNEAEHFYGTEDSDKPRTEHSHEIEPFSNEIV